MARGYIRKRAHVLVGGVALAALLLGCATGPTLTPTPTPTPYGTPPPTEPPAPSGTYDDRLRRVGEAVPGFGGMFTGPNSMVLNVYLLDNNDLSQVTPLRAALAREFPEDGDPWKLRLVKGDYTVVQLLDWYDDLRRAMGRSNALRGNLVTTGLEDTLNRLEIAVIDERCRRAVELAAEAAGVPLEAVIITVSGGIELLLAQDEDG